MCRARRTRRERRQPIDFLAMQKPDHTRPPSDAADDLQAQANARDGPRTAVLAVHVELHGVHPFPSRSPWGYPLKTVHPLVCLPVVVLRQALCNATAQRVYQRQ